MRRPLNWFVVCLSMLFLGATLSFDRDRNSTRQTSRPALAETDVVDMLSAPRSEPLFGYVRTDGSFLPLDKQDEMPAVADAGAAVSEWSSTISF